ncbi:MAG: sigma 54-interacting transcriptional regulator [Candidatus Sulfomarinibacteraceae bacterium]
MVINAPHVADAVLDCVADGVFTVDTDFRITYFNQAAEDILGYDRRQVLGRPCSEIFKSSICENGCGLKRSLEHDRPVMMRAIYVTNADGQRLPVCISAGVLRNESGEVIGAVETFRDLTHIEMVRTEGRRKILPNIIGQSPAMARVFELVPIVAESDSTVLIEGESGTGKELVARAVHELSSRRDKPMVVVNCGSIPDTLLESELFGHKAGSFTDARRDRPGRFELAEGGTIFLDEIGDVSPALQARLLRVLQERVIEPLGGTEPRPVDVRVISATNKNVSHLVAEGLFRKDLYYRINVVKISIPPLRDRRDDIPLLVDAMIRRSNEQGREIEGVAPEVMDVLLHHSYPGNVRELQNILEYAAVLCPRGVIKLSHLPDELGGPECGAPECHELVDSLQRSLIVAALERHHGNRRAAAEELSVHPTTLWRRAKRLGIEMPEVDGRSHPRRR